MLIVRVVKSIKQIRVWKQKKFASSQKNFKVEDKINGSYFYKVGALFFFKDQTKTEISLRLTFFVTGFN